jgi:hypothetical protein
LARLGTKRALSLAKYFDKIVPDAASQVGDLQEIALGEIVNDRGRTIFDPGFATAIRKIIDAEKL